MEISAVKKPVVGIIPTGDEIIPPTAEPREGEILEIQLRHFQRHAERLGRRNNHPIQSSRMIWDKIIETLRKALGECDAVILNAGSSAGSEDYSTEAIAAVGEVTVPRAGHQARKARDSRIERQ